MNRDAGAMDADKASAVAVLNNIHEHGDVSTQPVDVAQLDNRVWVVAAADTPAKAFCHPPAFQGSLRSLTIANIR